MKGLKKLALVSVIAAAPLAANAQLKAMDDASMSAATGQSGLVIEASFGTATGNAALAGFSNIAYSATNGIAIDAFKWTVTGYATDATGVMGASTSTPVGFGGIIASGITIQGAATVDIGATAGVGLGLTGSNGVAGSTGTGLGMTINGTMDIAVSDISTFAGTSTSALAQVDSFGAIEIDGLHLNNLGLILHGYGK